jgi:integrase
MFEAQRARVTEIEKATGKIIPWIFCRDDGSPIKGYRKAWTSACKRAGLSGKVMHDFRRTAVRNLNRAAIAHATAMSLTGHKTESVYRRYSIDDEASKREALAKLAVLHAADRGAERKVVPLAEGR